MAAFVRSEFDHMNENSVKVENNSNCPVDQTHKYPHIHKFIIIGILNEKS